jgi:hypothetical protein
MSGEQYRVKFRVHLAQAIERFDSIHARHGQVEHDCIEGILRHFLKSLAAAIGDLDVEPSGLHSFAESLDEYDFVVYQ